MKRTCFILALVVIFGAPIWGQGQQIGVPAPAVPQIQQPVGGGIGQTSPLPGVGLPPGQPAMSQPQLPTPPVSPVPPSPGRTAPTPERTRLDRSEMPVPPTAAATQGRTFAGGGGWVTGEAALAGGPFPAYMTGIGGPSAGFSAGVSAGRPIERPFADYSPPASVSPYINLYRPQSALGVAGNYYSLVRPMVQQQQVNRQLSQRLRQLSGPAHGGRSYIDRAAPAGGYFMNYYGFFPSLGGR